LLDDYYYSALFDENSSKSIMCYCRDESDASEDLFYCSFTTITIPNTTMNIPNQEYNEIESPKYKKEINPVKGDASVSMSNVFLGPMLRIALKKRESPKPIPRKKIRRSN